MKAAGHDGVGGEIHASEFVWSIRPRLRYKARIWSCATHAWSDLGELRLKIGYGYTAQAAYDDWARQ